MDIIDIFMIEKFTQGRVAVFIDAANIYFSQKTLGWKVDFKKLLHYFQQGSKTLFRVSYYGALNPENFKEKRFHDFLEIIGYRIRHKKIKFIKDPNDPKFGGHHKGNVDVELTIDAVHLKDQYDTFILFSGDSDFEPLIKYLKFYKKRCIVISSKGHVSIELIREAKFIDFKKLRSIIELK